MPSDAPDFVLLIQIGITLDNDVVAPSSLTEKVICALDRVTTSSATYQTVTSYTVPAGKSFSLDGVEMICSNYSVARFKLTIAGDVKFADKYLQSPFNPRFGGCALSTAAVVKLEVRSDGSTSITVDGSIEGKETG